MLTWNLEGYVSRVERGSQDAALAYVVSPEPLLCPFPSIFQLRDT